MQFRAMLPRIQKYPNLLFAVNGLTATFQVDRNRIQKYPNVSKNRRVSILGPIRVHDLASKHPIRIQKYKFVSKNIQNAPRIQKWPYPKFETP